MEKQSIKRVKRKKTVKKEISNGGDLVNDRKSETDDLGFPTTTATSARSMRGPGRACGGGTRYGG